MIDFYSLIKDTNAFKAVKTERDGQRLSHAYLIVSADGKYLTEYLKVFARLIACKNDYPCMQCRACKLIDAGAYPDLYVYPKNDDKSQTVSSENVNQLIEESYYKPVEGDKKIFIISQAQSMNASAQNKLLKTLEEPPKNVHILLGATSEYPLLATLKSRVKKLEIPAFSNQKLFNALKSVCPDEQKLISAIACGDGTLGGAEDLYFDQDLEDVTALVVDMILNMQSSSQVLTYSTKIVDGKKDISKFLSVLELAFRDFLVFKQGKENLAVNTAVLEKIKDAKGYSLGAIINALEKITEANKRKKFNANATMLIEWLLFQILEGKYKWQKL